MNRPEPNAVVIAIPDANATEMAFSQNMFRLKKQLAEYERSGARAGEYTVANKLTTLRHHAARAGQPGICIAASRLIGRVHRRQTPTTPDTAA